MFSHGCEGDAARQRCFCPCTVQGGGGEAAPLALHGIRGPFSHVREWPPWTPKRTRGEGPSTPDIAGLGLEELLSLRNQVRCTWLRHESLRVGSFSNRALLREARVTVVGRQTACGRGIAALAALFSLLLGGSC